MNKQWGKSALLFLDLDMIGVDDPMTYEVAMKSPEQEDTKLAIKEELDFIESNIKWVQVRLPPGREAIPYKMVLKQHFMTIPVLLDIGQVWLRKDTFRRNTPIMMRRLC